MHIAAMSVSQHVVGWFAAHEVEHYQRRRKK